MVLTALAAVIGWGALQLIEASEMNARVTGEVIEATYQPSKVTGRQMTVASCELVARYAVDGTTRLTTGTLPGKCAPVPGDPVSVIYNPAEPATSSVIAPDLGPGLAAIALGSFFAVFFVLIRQHFPS